MKVVWVNPKQPVKSEGRDLVKCGVCGKTGYFIPGGEWLWFELIIHPGQIKGYEEPFFCCSKECADKSEPHRKKRTDFLNSL